MKKLCNVVMLPTEKATKLLRNTYRFTKEHGNPLSYGNIDNATNRGYEYQHLYITSDGVINEGDWCTNKNLSEPYQYIGRIPDKNSRRIIASTDESLNLPGMPESFINRYAEENGGIDEILVEFSDFDSEEYRTEIDYFGRIDIGL